MNGYGTASFFMQKLPDDQFTRRKRSRKRWKGWGKFCKNWAEMLLKSVEEEGRDEGVIRGLGGGI